MTKKQLVSTVAKRTKTTRKEAGVMVDAILETMAEGLQEDGKLQLTGFGVFEVVERSARDGRNPASGEKVFVDAMNTVHFRASELLKNMINHNEKGDLLDEIG